MNLVCCTDEETDLQAAVTTRRSFCLPDVVLLLAISTFLQLRKQKSSLHPFSECDFLSP